MLDSMGNELLSLGGARRARLLPRHPRRIVGFADRLDDDGAGTDGLEIRVHMAIEGDTARFDFAGRRRRRGGPLNANPAIVRSAILYVIRALCEDDLPANDGLLDPVSIVVPSGCLLNPGPGHAVAGGNVETSQRIVDALLGAIAGAIPDRIPAASQGTMNNLALSGARPDGAPFTYYETVAGGAGDIPGPRASRASTPT